MIGPGAALGFGLSQRMLAWVAVTLRRLLVETADGGRLLAENGNPLILE